MSPTTIAGARATILVLAPAVMMAGLLSHPHLGSPFDPDFVPRLAAAVADGPIRWAVSHLAVAVGSGLLIVAFLALRGWLREAGEDRWSGPALPFIVMGSVLYALLPAMEFAPLAAFRAGADVEGVQAALSTWFVPTLVVGGLLFLAGSVGFAAGLVRSRRTGSALAWVAATALVATAVARLVPVSAVQFHLQAGAGLVAFWPLAYMAWTRRAAPAAGAPPDETPSGTTPSGDGPAEGRSPAPTPRAAGRGFGTPGVSGDPRV